MHIQLSHPEIDNGRRNSKKKGMLSFLETKTVATIGTDGNTQTQLFIGKVQIIQNDDSSYLCGECVGNSQTQSYNTINDVKSHIKECHLGKSKPRRYV